MIVYKRDMDNYFVDEMELGFIEWNLYILITCIVETFLMRYYYIIWWIDEGY